MLRMRTVAVCTAITVCLLGLGSPVFADDCDELQKQIEGAKSKLAIVEKSIAEASAELDEVRAKIEFLRRATQISKSSKQAARLKKALIREAELVEQINALEIEAANLKTFIEAAEADLEAANC